MTREEARRIGSIAELADGGCIYCITTLVEALNKEFPDFKWEIIQVEGENKVVLI